MNLRERLTVLARSLNATQRLVVTVGLGVALIAVGRAAETWRSGPVGGWFGYTPLSREVFPGASFLALHPGFRLLMWLALTGAWTAVSVWLFGPRAREE